MTKERYKTCGELVYRVKNDKKELNRNLIKESKTFNSFFKAWINKFDNLTNDEFVEKMIYLWVTINAWASIVVPDSTKNHNDSYLIHAMSADEQLNSRFSYLMSKDDAFQKNVEELLTKAPVFQVLWMRNNNAIPWDQENEDRDVFIKRIMKLKPYNRSQKGDLIPAFSPACAEKHLGKIKQIPLDWAHTLHTIYQIRCNLFHGGKDYSNNRDRKFIELAYMILRAMFEHELPIDLELTWNQILIRSGFMVNNLCENSGNKFDLSLENEANIAYFTKIISELDLSSYFDCGLFCPPSESIKQIYWFKAVEKAKPHSGIDLPDLENIDLSLLDPYMAGIVRWLNKAGLATSFSCEGHGNSKPKIIFHPNDGMIFEICLKLLRGHGLIYRNKYLDIDGNSNTYRTKMISSNMKLKLLDLAEILYRKNQELSELILNVKKFE